MNEDIVYTAVINGDLQIDQKGRIWRIRIRQGDRWTRKVRKINCCRRRAEHRTPIGYLQIRMMTDGVRVHASAHRVVWRHLRGPIPNGLTINHKNGRKDDNRPENLELATQSEQAIHAVHVLKVGRTVNQKGEQNHACKLTDVQVVEIRKRRLLGEKLSSIAADFDVTFQTISRIARRTRR